MKEYTDTMKRRYTRASKSEKGALLDEFVEVTGYHRKSAVRCFLAAVGMAAAIIGVGLRCTAWR